MPLGLVVLGDFPLGLLGFRRGVDDLRPCALLLLENCHLVDHRADGLAGLVGERGGSLVRLRDGVHVAVEHLKRRLALAHSLTSCTLTISRIAIQSVSGVSASSIACSNSAIRSR